MIQDVKTFSYQSKVYLELFENSFERKKIQYTFELDVSRVMYGFEDIAMNIIISYWCML